MRFRYPLMLTLAALLVACGAGSDKPDERKYIESCQLNCLEYGFGLLSQERYEDAETVLNAVDLDDRAARSSESLPFKKVSERYQIAAARAVIAHRTEGEPSVPSADFQELLSTSNWDAFEAADLSFLSKRDRRWFLRAVKKDSLLHSEFARVSSNARTAPAEVGELAPEGDDLGALLSAVFVSRRGLGDAVTWNLDLTARTITVLSGLEEVPDGKFLFGEKVWQSFLVRARPEHRVAVEALVELMANYGWAGELEVPESALGESEACKLLRPYLGSMAAAHAYDAEKMLEIARCSARVGSYDAARSAARRALKLDESYAEAVRFLLHISIVQSSTRPKIPEGMPEIEAEKKMIDELWESVRGFEFEEVRSALDGLPWTPVVSFMSAVVAQLEGNHSRARFEFGRVADRWPFPNVLTLLGELSAREGIQAEPFFSKWGDTFASFSIATSHLLAALAFDSEDELATALDQADLDRPNCSAVKPIAMGIEALKSGDGQAWLAKYVARKDRKWLTESCRMWMHASYELGGMALLERLSSQRQDFETPIFSSNRVCPKSSLAAAKRELDPDNKSSVNGVVWCLVLRGEFEEAAKYLEDHGSSNDDPTWLRDTRAWVLWGTGKEAEAVVIWEDLGWIVPAMMAKMTAGQVTSKEEYWSKSIRERFRYNAAHRGQIFSKRFIEALRELDPEAASEASRIFVVETGFKRVEYPEPCNGCAEAFEAEWGHRQKFGLAGTEAKDYFGFLDESEGVKSCVAAASPDGAHHLTLRWTLSAEGAVSDMQTVTSDVDDRELEACLRAAIPSLEFEAPGRELNIVYPVLVEVKGAGTP